MSWPLTPQKGSWLSFFYRQRDRGSEKSINLVTVTRVGSRKAGADPQVTDSRPHYPYHCLPKVSQTHLMTLTFHLLHLRNSLPFILFSPLRGRSRVLAAWCPQLIVLRKVCGTDAEEARSLSWTPVIPGRSSEPFASCPSQAPPLISCCKAHMR